jgi:hypothetical protein
MAAKLNSRYNLQSAEAKRLWRNASVFAFANLIDLLQILIDWFEQNRRAQYLLFPIVNKRQLCYLIRPREINVNSSVCHGKPLC